MTKCQKTCKTSLEIPRLICSICDWFSKQNLAMGLNLTYPKLCLHCPLRHNQVSTQRIPFRYEYSLVNVDCWSLWKGCVNLYWKVIINDKLYCLFFREIKPKMLKFLEQIKVMWTDILEVTFVNLNSDAYI